MIVRMSTQLHEISPAPPYFHRYRSYHHRSSARTSWWLLRSRFKGYIYSVRNNTYSGRYPIIVHIRLFFHSDSHLLNHVANHQFTHSTIFEPGAELLCQRVRGVERRCLVSKDVVDICCGGPWSEICLTYS